MGAFWKMFSFYKINHFQILKCSFIFFLQKFFELPSSSLSISSAESILLCLLLPPVLLSFSFLKAQQQNTSTGLTFLHCCSHLLTLTVKGGKPSNKILESLKQGNKTSPHSSVLCHCCLFLVCHFYILN